MSLTAGILLVLSVVMFVYVGAALVKPEWF